MIDEVLSSKRKNQIKKTIGIIGTTEFSSVRTELNFYSMLE